MENSRVGRKTSCKQTNIHHRRGGTIGLSFRLACGRLDVQILAATYLSRNTSSDSLTAKRSATELNVTGPLRWPLLTYFPCHRKEPLLLISHECRVCDKICSSSPVILEWYVKPSRNKETLFLPFLCHYSLVLVQIYQNLYVWVWEKRGSESSGRQQTGWDLKKELGLWKKESKRLRSTREDKRDRYIVR